MAINNIWICYKTKKSALFHDILVETQWSIAAMKTLRLAIGILMLQLIAVLESSTAHMLVITNLLNSTTIHVTCLADPNSTLVKTVAPLQIATFEIIQNPSWTCWGTIIHSLIELYNQRMDHEKCKDNCLLVINSNGSFLWNEETNKLEKKWPSYLPG